MTTEEEFDKRLNELTRDPDQWTEIKRILNGRIRSYQDILKHIDRIIQQKESDFSKLN